MEFYSAILPGVILLTVGAIVGVVLLVRARHVVSAALLALVVVAALAPGSALAWDRSPLTNPITMHVDGLIPPRDPGLTVEIVHQHVSDDGTEYQFVARGGPDAVAATFQSQHPDAVVTSADPALVGNGGHSVWHLAAENVRFDLIAAPTKDTYELVTQAVTLVPDDGSASVRIPFPRSGLNATEVIEGQIYTDGWTAEQWADFYAGVTDVTVDGNTITVPTDAGDTATITLSEGISKVTIDD